MADPQTVTRQPTDISMNGEALLEHAAGLVNRRRREYGEPADLFEHVAQRWSLTLGSKISPAQVVLCLIDLKLAGSPATRSTSTARSMSRAMRRSCVR
jgi:Domain of unknown function (DUF6378)